MSDSEHLRSMGLRLLSTICGLSKMEVYFSQYLHLVITYYLSVSTCVEGEESYIYNKYNK